MFFGKQQTGFMNQPPAVNMVNQPGTMPGVSAAGMPQDAFGYSQPVMGGVPAQGMPMEGFIHEQMTPDAMCAPGPMMPDMCPQQMHDPMCPQHPMNYVCEPCEIFPSPQPQPQVHVVQKGDTVYKIAKKHGLDWRELASYNHLANPDLIYPGERLFIPSR